MCLATCVNATVIRVVCSVRNTGSVTTVMHLLSTDTGSDGCSGQVRGTSSRTAGRLLVHSKNNECACAIGDSIDERFFPLLDSSSTLLRHPV